MYEQFAKGRKRTWRGDLQKINTYLLPAWGHLPLRDITRAHVHELLDKIVAKGLTTGVNRVQSVISRLFTIALDRSLVEAHPAARMIKRFKEQPSDRVLTDDELRALWAGLDAHPEAASEAIRLWLLLAQRGGTSMPASGNCQVSAQRTRDRSSCRSRRPRTPDWVSACWRRDIPIGNIAQILTTTACFFPVREISGRAARFWR